MITVPSGISRFMNTSLGNESRKALMMAFSSSVYRLFQPSPFVINVTHSMWHESTKLLIHTRACSWELVHRNLPVRTFGSGNISTF